MQSPHAGNVAVIGGGLVGSLASAVLAHAGYPVTLYESRGGTVHTLLFVFHCLTC
eukprot:m.16526 g.16526  ORF g.16526 m.16526 type:complete len:55 (+) comp26984_c0_seq2:49-213(+)